MDDDSSDRSTPTPPTSSFLRQQHNDGTTTSSAWLDDLPTVRDTIAQPDHAERSDSSDRKRRHADSSPEVRRGMPRSQDASRDRAGNSMESAIDLTSSPPLRATHSNPPRPPLPQHHRSGSGSTAHLGGGVRLTGSRPVMGSIGDRPSFTHRDNSRSEYHRPPMRPPRIASWQPDSVVTQCPICKTRFTFLYRKHHCRKCGRVVCANCSPHRITIPRQYIVQPPGTSEGDPTACAPSPTRLDGSSEIVRVCNPCVPDPWLPDPWTADSEGGGAGRDMRNWQSRPPGHVASRPPPFPTPLPFEIQHLGPLDQAPPAVPQFGGSLPGARPAPVIRSPANPPTNVGVPRPYGRPPLPPGYFQQPHQTQPLRARWPMPSPGSLVFPPANDRPPLPNPPFPPRPNPTRPRREIPEEDECPVCGNEYPPGPPASREEHVQHCIELRFSSTPEQRRAVASSIAPPRGSSMGDNRAPSAPPATTSNAAAAATSISLPATAMPGSRPRAPSYRPRTFLPYHASEKDCVTEDGSAQECVICLEEFQPGDEMGRMECLCKFHRECIRSWQERKGVGSCPTHMLHD